MRTRLALLAVPLALTVGSPAAAVPAGHEPAPRTDGIFRTWTEATPAVTYQPAAVPVGARATVVVDEIKTGVRVRLTAAGLVPGRSYGAHLHNRPCTDKPADAGPHYQHRVDPAADPAHPSADPAYANPQNEIWLDFTADARGAGGATSEQKWSFDSSRPPWSLVLHEEHTHTAPGEAGTAGARLACMTRTAIKPYVNRHGRG